MNNERAKSVDIVFGSGVRQDLNPQTAPVGTLVSADNVEFDQLGRLVRRDGFLSLALTAVSKTNAVTPPVRRFAQTPDGARLMFTDQNAHLYFPTLNKTCEAGLDAQRSTVRASLMETTAIAADSVGNISYVDAVGVGTYAIYVYVIADAFGGGFKVRAEVVDTTTGARVITGAVLGTTSNNVQPRVVSSGGGSVAFVVWQGATPTTLQYSRLDLSATTLAWSAAANLVTDVDSPPVFDVDKMASGWVLVYARSAAGHACRVITYDSTPAATHTYDWLTASATAWTPSAVAVCGDSIGGGGQVQCAGYDFTTFKMENLVVTSALALVNQQHFDPGISHSKFVTQLALGRRSTFTTVMLFSAYTSATRVTDPRGHLYCYSVASTAVATLDGVFANYSLGSKVYTDSRNNGVFAMARFDDPSGFQNHYLLLDFGTGSAHGFPVPTLHVASGLVRLGIDNAFTGIGGMVDLSGKTPGLFQFVASLNVGANLYSGGQVVEWSFQSLSTNRFLSTQCQGEAVLGGGTPLAYDGQRLVELSFYSWPVVGSGNFTPANTGGFIAQGIYQYRLVYEWTDARGNRHQSPASPAITVDMSSATYAANTNKVAIVAPAYHATRKQVQFPVGGSADVAAPIIVVCYRTKAGGSVFYRLPGGCVNNTASAADDSTFNDANNDTIIGGDEPLYTAGGGAGVLATTAPPPTIALTTHAQRLWGVDGENPERIWCTKVLAQDSSPAYNQALQVLIPGAGRINGLGGQDGKLYALATNGIYLASYGDGPDDTGGGTFPSPQLITTTANCQDPRSVLVGQDGIFFVGKDQWGTGIYMIRRGDGQPVSIGKRVRRELASFPVCRGVVNRTGKARTEFLFVDSDTNPTNGVVLYYHHDYLDAEGIGQWTVSRIASFLPECIGVWDDVTVLSSTSGSVGLQTAGELRDFGTRTSVYIETADVRPAGLVGFAQVAGVTLLGTASVQDPIKIGLSYDSGFSFPDVFQFLNPTESTGQPVLRRVDPVTQKQYNGGAVRVQVADLAGPDPEIGPFQGTTYFHGVTLELVPLGGNARVDNARRA